MITIGYGFYDHTIDYFLIKCEKWFRIEYVGRFAPVMAANRLWGKQCNILLKSRVLGSQKMSVSLYSRWIP